MKKRNIDVILACSDLGVNVEGSEIGPQILINKLDEKLMNNINTIKTVKKREDYKKEKEKTNKKKNLKEIKYVNNKIYNEVKKSLDNNCFPITVGGDHSIAIASSLASINKYKNLGIIWFDAHGDFHTFETTTTGNIHGLPFAAVTGYEKKELSEFYKGDYYKFKNAVLFGVRDIDLPGEIENLKKAGITIITADDIKKYGVKKMCEKAFEIAGKSTVGIHISYDIDCVDPSILPGVSVPARGGLNLEEANFFVDYMIANNEKIKSIDFVEFNPLRDKNKITEKVSVNILKKLIKNI